MIFPRVDDGKPRAWRMRGTQPTEIWERFSAAYEAQAETLWNAITAIGLTAEIDGAGSEDGEFIIARDAEGQAKFFVHLEEPASARDLADAIREDRLQAYLQENE